MVLPGLTADPTHRPPDPHRPQAEKDAGDTVTDQTPKTYRRPLSYDLSKLPLTPPDPSTWPTEVYIIQADSPKDVRVSVAVVQRETLEYYECDVPVALIGDAPVVVEQDATGKTYWVAKKRYPEQVIKYRVALNVHSAIQVAAQECLARRDEVEATLDCLRRKRDNWTETARGLNLRLLSQSYSDK